MLFNSPKINARRSGKIYGAAAVIFCQNGDLSSKKQGDARGQPSPQARRTGRVIKSFPSETKILIFAPQKHQYLKEEVIIINDSFSKFLRTFGVRSCFPSAGLELI